MIRARDGLTEIMIEILEENNIKKYEEKPAGNILSVFYISLIVVFQKLG